MSHKWSVLIELGHEAEYPQFLQDPQILVSIRTESSAFIPWMIHPRIGESEALYDIMFF